MAADSTLRSASRCCSPDLYDRRKAPAEASQSQDDWWAKLGQPARSAMLQLHEVFNVPWWATIGLCGVSLRLAVLPLSLKANAVGASIVQGRKNAVRHMADLIGAPMSAGLSPELTTHEVRQRELATKLAPGSTSRLWLAAPLLQVRRCARGLVTAEGHVCTLLVTIVPLRPQCRCRSVA